MTGGGEDDTDSPDYGFNHDKPVLNCDTFGCGQKPVDESGRCRVCREAYKNGFCEGHKKALYEAVRGRQEIEEKLEEIKEDVKKLEKQLEDSNGEMREMVLAKVLNEYQMALDVLYWVLGEVDDL